jgi:hypothetical protein
MAIPASFINTSPNQLLARSDSTRVTFPVARSPIFSFSSLPFLPRRRLAADSVHHNFWPRTTLYPFSSTLLTSRWPKAPRNPSRIPRPGLSWVEDDGQGQGHRQDQGQGDPCEQLRVLCAIAVGQPGARRTPALVSGSHLGDWARQPTVGRQRPGAERALIGVLRPRLSRSPSLDGVRYELRMGPLGDPRASGIWVQTGAREAVPQWPSVA